MIARHLTVAACALGAVLTLAACSDNAAGKARVQLPPVPVTVGEAVEKTMPVQLTAVGNAQAYTTVGIKSQINGQLVEVRFKEGQDVKKNDLLFVIDPRPFEAALRSAEAALSQRQAEVRQAQAAVERDSAQLQNARVQEQRYRELVAKELIAREQYDTLNTNMTAMQATVEADRAAVENANDDNPIVVINQIHPIYVSFSVPEQYLGDIKKYGSTGRLQVVARPPRQQETLATGELTFVNNTVDQTTGTIQLKATFANEANGLWPGQFLDVAMTITSRTAIVVPSQAIQPGQQGPYVFVVKPDQTVEARLVTPGVRLGAETIVEKGLKPAERVVTDGQLRLVPGARIEARPMKAS
jgi:multidrug efflux system membrane fusion protein